LCTSQTRRIGGLLSGELARPLTEALFVLVRFEFAGGLVEFSIRPVTFSMPLNYPLCCTPEAGIFRFVRPAES
jgi:hypothetical protein